MDRIGPRTDVNSRIYTSRHRLADSFIEEFGHANLR
jgi:hypothetical protein